MSDLLEMLLLPINCLGFVPLSPRTSSTVEWSYSTHAAAFEAKDTYISKISIIRTAKQQQKIVL